MQRILTAPIVIGNIDTIGPGVLTVHTVFDPVTTAFQVSSISMTVREGEVQFSEIPAITAFVGKRNGSVERAAEDIPTAILTQIEALLNKGLELYAAQEGYELAP